MYEKFTSTKQNTNKIKNINNENTRIIMNVHFIQVRLAYHDGLLRLSSLIQIGKNIQVRLVKLDQKNYFG